jgi:hypothetical protein
MVSRKLLAVAGVAIMMISLSASADEPSPCQDGRRHLISGWEAEGLPGTKDRPTRTSIVCLPDGGLRQIVEVSKDNGKTWKTLFESTYRPGTQSEMATAEPVVQTPMAPSAAPVAVATSSTPAPATAVAQPQAQRQTTSEGSSVKAVTRELQRQEIPQEQAPELVMESPMVLEVTPGDVSKYPQNAGWRSTETASFICDEVVLKQVGLGRRVKGDSVDLIVEAKIFTRKRQKKADLAIEVIHDGQVVASDELRNIKVGLNIPAHGLEGLWTSVKMRVTRELFDQMLAGENRPVVRFTLTVY